jgi:hypothetical protein
MERLTKISETGNAYYPKCFEEPCCGMGECLDDRCSLMLDACKKLAEYEQLEEQGLLVRLPCKVGTEVYYILGIPNKTPCAIDKCVFKLSDIDKIGESLFLTHKETEKKLEELKNEI